MNKSYLSLVVALFFCHPTFANVTSATPAHITSSGIMVTDENAEFDMNSLSNDEAKILLEAQLTASEVTFVSEKGAIFEVLGLVSAKEGLFSGWGRKQVNRNHNRARNRNMRSNQRLWRFQRRH